VNPLTCLLARTIRTWLIDHGVIERGDVDLLWGDALEFGTGEYQQYSEGSFDALIAENVYTGQFFENQVQMTSHTMQAGLVPTERDDQNTCWSRRTTVPVVPSSMVTCLELVECGERDGPDGDPIDRTMTGEYPYVEFEYTADRPAPIVSTVACEIRSAGQVGAALAFSVLKLGPEDYIGRGRDRFLGNDVLLVLDGPIAVEAGDTVACGLAYRAGDDLGDLVFELRGPADADRRRLDIGEQRHRRNRAAFAEATGLDPSFDFCTPTETPGVTYQTVRGGERQTVYSGRIDPGS
jgi:hypothetical protein